MVKEGESGKAVKIIDLPVKRAGVKMTPLRGKTWVARSRFDMECSEVEKSARKALQRFRHQNDVDLAGKVPN
jgi:hypothetical protein